MDIVDANHIWCPYCKLELINEYGVGLPHDDYHITDCDRCGRTIKVITTKVIKYSTYLVEKGNHHPSSD